MKEVYSSKAQFSLMAQCTGKFVLTSLVITRRKMNVKRRPSLIMHSKPHLRVKPLAVTYNCFIKSIFYGLLCVVLASAGVLADRRDITVERYERLDMHTLQLGVCKWCSNFGGH